MKHPTATKVLKGLGITVAAITEKHYLNHPIIIHLTLNIEIEILILRENMIALKNQRTTVHIRCSP